MPPASHVSSATPAAWVGAELLLSPLPPPGMATYGLLYKVGSPISKNWGSHNGVVHSGASGPIPMCLLLSLWGLIARPGS